MKISQEHENIVISSLITGIKFTTKHMLTKYHTSMETLDYWDTLVHYNDDGRVVSGEIQGNSTTEKGETDNEIKKYKNLYSST